MPLKFVEKYYDYIRSLVALTASSTIRASSLQIPRWVRSVKRPGVSVISNPDTSLLVMVPSMSTTIMGVLTPQTNAKHSATSTLGSLRYLAMAVGKEGEGRRRRESG